MPFRTIGTLRSWVGEFERRERLSDITIRVIPQDGADGADTGLVAVRIPDSPVEIYIEPPSPETGPEWSITFEPRDYPLTLGARAVVRIAGEMVVLGSLCAFLQQKSDAFLAQHSAERRG